MGPRSDDIQTQRAANRYWRVTGLQDLELFSARFRRHTYRRHSHAGYVVGVVIDGAERFFCRNAVHTAGPGDIILVNPQSQHDGQAACDLGWAYRVIYPTEAHFLTVSGAKAPPRFAKAVVHDPELFARIARFHRAMEQPQPVLEAETVWAGILFDLVSRHADHRPSGAFDRDDPGRIGVAENLLRAHAVSGIALSDVAEQVGWSQWHLIRAFKRARGISPHALVIDCRLRHAKRLIDADEPLAAASVAAGFVDQSHFSNLFVRAYGFTPGQYRQARRA